MAKVRRKSPIKLNEPPDRILQRIARRYEQLDQQLRELEAKLPELPDRGEEPASEEPADPNRPKKPR